MSILAHAMSTLMVLIWKKKSDDSEEVEILNLENDMSRMVGGVNMSSNSKTKSSDKRKERDPSKVQGRKKKMSGIGV